MLRTAIILYTLVFITSAASAEVYKWEDANGIHFTDSLGSVPEKYREKVYEETRKQIKNTTPQVRVGVSQLNIPAVVTQINQVAVYQANLEQQRGASEAMRQQQARALAVSTKNLDNAFQSLARFMAMAHDRFYSFSSLGWQQSLILLEASLMILQIKLSGCY